MPPRRVVSNAGPSSAGHRRAPKVRLPRAQGESEAPTAENRAALRLVKALKGPNEKYINNTYSAINLNPTTTAPGLVLLNGVAQGTSENTRIGRLCRLKWLDIDIEAYLGSTNVPTFSNVRMYIAVETTCLGSAIAPSQFFVDGSVFTANSQRDRTNRNASRYCVLWDSKPFSLGTVPQSASGTNVWSPNIGSVAAVRNISLHLALNFSTDYSRGNAGTVADIDTNSLYLLVVTDYNTGGGALAVGGSWTLAFSDDE